MKGVVGHSAGYVPPTVAADLQDIICNSSHVAWVYDVYRAKSALHHTNRSYPWPLASRRTKTQQQHDDATLLHMGEYVYCSNGARAPLILTPQYLGLDTHVETKQWSLAGTARDNTHSVPNMAVLALMSPRGRQQLRQQQQQRRPLALFQRGQVDAFTLRAPVDLGDITAVQVSCHTSVRKCGPGCTCTKVE